MPMTSVYEFIFKSFCEKVNKNKTSKHIWHERDLNCISGFKLYSVEKL